MENMSGLVIFFRTDTDEVLERFGGEAFRDYLLQENEDKCMEMDEVVKKRVTDTRAREEIIKEFGTITPSAGYAKMTGGFSLPPAICE